MFVPRILGTIINGWKFITRFVIVNI
jgi:hypothetical protein